MNENIKCNPAVALSKKIAGLLLLSCLVMGMTECNKDFLNTDPKESYILLDTLVLNDNTGHFDLPLNIPEIGNSGYIILQFPKWMDFDNMQGIFKEGLTNLSFNLAKDLFPEGKYDGELVLNIDGFGFLTIPVIFRKLGNSYIQTSTLSLNFGDNTTSSLDIRNIGQGTLLWKIRNLPSWLSVSRTDGELDAGSTVTINAVCDRGELAIGDYTDTIVLESNAKNGDLKLQVRMKISHKVTFLEGTVTDARFLALNDKLYLLTKNPDRLVIKDTRQNTFSNLNLDNSPSSISISEDGSQAVIGYETPEVSLVDLGDLSIKKSFDLSFIPYNVIISGENWCYISPNTRSWDTLVCLNLVNGEQTRSSFLFGRITLRKIPDKPVLIGTSPDSDPNGLQIMGIENGLISDTIVYYSVYTYNFWISHDGMRIYCGSGSIYKNPGYLPHIAHDFAPDLIAKIVPVKNHINWIDDCLISNSLFVSESGGDYWGHYPSVIEQFSCTDYSLTNSYELLPYTLMKDNKPAIYRTDLNFGFVNSSGTAIYAIKNVGENIDFQNVWSIEEIPVK
jgi:hypothetical protein